MEISDAQPLHLTFTWFLIDQAPWKIIHLIVIEGKPLTDSTIYIFKPSGPYESLSRLQSRLQGVQGEEADVDCHAGHPTGEEGRLHRGIRRHSNESSERKEKL
jgi:hypothetical protein